MMAGKIPEGVTPQYSSSSSILGASSLEVPGIAVAIASDISRDFHPRANHQRQPASEARCRANGARGCSENSTEPQVVLLHTLLLISNLRLVVFCLINITLRCREVFGRLSSSFSSGVAPGLALRAQRG